MRSAWFGLLASLAACSAPAGPDLYAVLWAQNAAEYRASCAQTFVAATRALDQALADPEWTAAIEQDGDASQKPAAVICDVDETLLDNTAYNARLLEDGGAFALDTWNAWVREERAGAVAGAREFAARCAECGVTVFYVTNRAPEVEEATRRNLARLGFPLATELDVVLTRSEHDKAGSEKGPRRARVATTHRILLLVGDDLGDFVPGVRGMSPAERSAAAERHASYHGERWFVLPNPIYGSWLSALGADPALALRTER
jgi:acid phosphatase